MKDRVNKKRPEKYTLTSNKILQDGRLSYEAIGIFCYLWSMPDDWQVMVKQVMKHNNSTEYQVRKALRQLRDYGYMKWIRTQGYFIYDICEDGSFHCSDIQHNDIHCSDIQHNDIYIQNNNLNKTIKQTPSFSPSFENPTVKENLTHQSSISEIPNNSVSAKNIHTQKQDIENKQFQEFWNLYEKPKKAVNWNAGNVKQAKNLFIYALKQCESFEWLMQNTKDYLTVKSTGKHGDGVKRGICSFLSKRDFPYLINWNEKLQEIKGIDPKNTVVIKQDQVKVQEEKQTKKEANNVKYQTITSKLQKLNAEKLCNDIQQSIATSISDIHKNLYDFQVLDIFEKNDSMFLGIQTKNEPNEFLAEKLQNILQREAQFCFGTKYKKFEIFYFFA